MLRICHKAAEYATLPKNYATKIMKSHKKQDQVPPCDPKLCQNGATASGNPPECPPPKKQKSHQKSSEKGSYILDKGLGSPLGPLGPMVPSDVVT